MQLPLIRGERGPAVADLQKRLAVRGYPCQPDPDGAYLDATVSAVSRFQLDAGLDVDGRCSAVTWQSLVEAGYHLGDRQLYLRSPMTRGDDVAELQRRLGALGFNAGRVDGIFGPLTARALADFQRNSGLPTDGIFGPESAAALDRLGRGRTDAMNVAHVREQERLRHRPRDLRRCRIALGETGGLGALMAPLSHQLRELGAVVATLDHPDWSVQAREANDFEADVYLGLRLILHEGIRAAFFRTAGFESAGGRRLAELVARELVHSLGTPAEPATGMRLPVLRETRMPAVLCEAGPPRLIVERGAELARGLAAAIGTWAEEPLLQPETSLPRPS